MSFQFLSFHSRDEVSDNKKQCNNDKQDEAKSAPLSVRLQILFELVHASLTAYFFLHRADVKIAVPLLASAFALAPEET